MNEIRPLKSRILVKVLAEPEKKVGGIILAETKERSSHVRATVIAVGMEVSSVSTGDVVLISSYCGTNIGNGQDELRIVPESEIIGTFEQ